MLIALMLLVRRLDAEEQSILTGAQLNNVMEIEMSSSYNQKALIDGGFGTSMETTPVSSGQAAEIGISLAEAHPVGCFFILNYFGEKERSTMNNL